jgi:hypothetical protein
MKKESKKMMDKKEPKKAMKHSDVKEDKKLVKDMVKKGCRK